MPKDIFTLDSMAARVVWLREQKKMRPADLSRAAKISQPTLWAIENGVTTPDKVRASTLMRLADVLDSTPEWIRDGKGDPHNSTPGDSKELLAIYSGLDDTLKAALIAAARALKG